MTGRGNCARRMGIFTIFAIALMLFGGVAGCGEDDNGDEKTMASTAGTSTTGSRATDDVEHSVTVTSFTYPFETHEYTNPPDAGMVLAKVELRIVNEGDADYEANANLFVIEDVSGEDYAHFIFYDAADAMGSSSDSDVVAPGEELEVSLAFEVPPGLELAGVREGLGHPEPGDLYALP